MLTKTDLKAIDTIVTKRVRQEVHQEVSHELKPINKKLDLIVSFFDQEIVSVKKRVKRIEDHLHLPAITS